MSARATGRVHRGRTAAIAIVATIVTVAQVAVGLELPRIIGDRRDASTRAAFAVQPAGAVPGAPGTLVKVEPLAGTPFLSQAWRIMYRSTDLHGRPFLATGTVITPLGPIPDGGRIVLGWGHPTTGTASACAPSQGADPYLGIEGLRMMLTRGYTVVAPDYAGMGTEGPDSYLIGDTAAHTLLDGIRAAQRIPQAHAGDRVVLWGHSQGGQAVLFAAEDAPDYAPALRIAAVAAAAPAADLIALVRAHLDDISGVTIGSYAFPAFESVYGSSTPGLQLDDILTPGAIRNLDEMNALCLLPDLSRLHEIGTPLVGGFFAKDPTVTEPWKSLLVENSAGRARIDAPVFIAQGTSDRLVIPAATAAFVDRERALGTRVTYNTVPSATHGTVAYLTLPALNGWLDAVVGR